MRSTRDRMARPLAAAGATIVAVAGGLAWGAPATVAKTETSFARYYEDSLENMCVGVNPIFPPGIFGGSCLWESMSGRFNVGAGYLVMSAGGGARTGGENTAAGAFALRSNTSGASNTAAGFSSMANNRSGQANTAAGTGALAGNVTGYENVAIGIKAGGSIATGSGNIDISNPAVAPAESNTIRVGVQGRAPETPPSARRRGERLI